MSLGAPKKDKCAGREQGDKAVGPRTKSRFYSEPGPPGPQSRLAVAEHGLIGRWRIQSENNGGEDNNGWA